MDPVSSPPSSLLWTPKQSIYVHRQNNKNTIEQTTNKKHPGSYIMIPYTPLDTIASIYPFTQHIPIIYKL